MATEALTRPRRAGHPPVLLPEVAEATFERCEPYSVWIVLRLPTVGPKTSDWGLHTESHVTVYVYIKTHNGKLQKVRHFLGSCCTLNQTA